MLIRFGVAGLLKDSRLFFVRSKHQGEHFSHGFCKVCKRTV